MAFFDKSSPALHDALLGLYRASNTKPSFDHRIYELGAVEYHVRSSGSDRDGVVYVSVSAPFPSSNGIAKLVDGISLDAIEIVEPPEDGYDLTLKLDFEKITRLADHLKIIGEISALRATISSRWLKEILRDIDRRTTVGLIKLEYRPKEPFFVIGQKETIVVVFPMRFKEDTDVTIAIPLFQELTDSSDSDRAAPSCTWSPIPPPELIGESLEDLSTNGGFVSFDLSSKHLKGKNMDKTVWNLLNFITFVKFHVKATRGFLHRRIRNRTNNLVEVLHASTGGKRDDDDDDDVAVDDPGCGCFGNAVGLGLPRKRRSTKRGGKIRRTKGVAGRVVINGLRRFRRRWLRLPRFSPAAFKYRKVSLQ